MQKSFQVDISTDSVELNTDRQADLAFTVTNTTDDRVCGRTAIELRDEQATRSEWFDPKSSSFWFEPKGKRQVVERITVPDTEPPGRLMFQLLVASEEHPEEDWTLSSTVAVVVKKRPESIVEKPQPWHRKWWVWAVAGGVVAIAAGVAVPVALKPRGVGEECGGWAKCGGTLTCADVPNKGKQCLKPIGAGCREGRECISQSCDEDKGTCRECGEEVCDGKDNNCDGQIDEGSNKRYLDADGDGYGQKSAHIRTVCPGGRGAYTAKEPGDCYDDNPKVFPGQSEYFSEHRGDSSFDYNCDGRGERRWIDTGRCPKRSSSCTANYNSRDGWLQNILGMQIVAECGETREWLYDCSQVGTSCKWRVARRTQECR